jgi:hypothetical protein
LKVSWRFDTADPNGKTFDLLMDLLHFVGAAKGQGSNNIISFILTSVSGGGAAQIANVG